MKLLAPKDYDFLNGTGCLEDERIDDAAGDPSYALTKAAFESINLGGELDYVFMILAAILHLGNCSFEGEPAKCTTPEPLAIVAELLGTDAAQLEAAVCIKKTQVRGETFESPVDGAEATSSRDSLARSLYGRMFDWIVDRANAALGGGGDAASDLQCIGVLDIFGFETFETNTYEQFCINFTNEKLQNTFSKHIFCMEQALYLEEQIQWQNIQWPDNSAAIDVISKPPQGIFQRLDESCRLPNPKVSFFFFSFLIYHVTFAQHSN